MTRELVFFFRFLSLLSTTGQLYHSLDMESGENLLQIMITCVLCLDVMPADRAPIILGFFIFT